MMFVIGEATIDWNIAEEQFACDLAACKGACCTLAGGRGAPLEDSEVAEIERAFPAASKYLPRDHRNVIERKGMIEGTPGNYATTCIDDRACVFVYYEHDVAKCSLEKAFINGETQWRKPISCHLFPIRVSGRASFHVRYEEISECAAGRARGSKEHIALSDFLEDALTRKFSSSWYRQFQDACRLRVHAQSKKVV